MRRILPDQLVLVPAFHDHVHSCELQAISRILDEHPEAATPTLGITRVFVKRFPFSVYFIELPTRFRVLAVAHGGRRPFYWGDRL